MDECLERVELPSRLYRRVRLHVVCDIITFCVADLLLPQREVQSGDVRQGRHHAAGTTWEPGQVTQPFTPRGRACWWEGPRLARLKGK